MANDYRLVVELESSARADALRDELAAVFAAHAQAYDARTEEPGGEWPGRPTDDARAFGAR